MTLPGSHGEHRAQEQYGTTRRALSFYTNQVLNFLNPAMRDFIARQEMVFVATADARGACDGSFRAGLSGFVQILGERLLAYPEYRGNGVLASVGNMLENAHVGLLFIDFVHSTIGLHVNGSSRVLENAEVLSRPDITPEMVAAIKGAGERRPERWVLVEVEEAYIHCSKHIPRMQKLDKDIHWGTDDEQHKGGDYFKARTCPRPWGREPSTDPPDGTVGRK